jgi:hypothetical protein
VKFSIQILTSPGILAFDTQSLSFWEFYSNEGEIVLAFKGSSEPVSLFQKDVSSSDFETLLACLQKEFPDISSAKVLEQP